MKQMGVWPMLRVTEVFHSLQGEGKYVGIPSLFLRVYGCNLRCLGFGMPPGVLTTEIDEIAAQYKGKKNYRLEDLPVPRTGCDSYPTWHPEFKGLSPVMNNAAVVERLKACKADAKHLVITGGEPLLPKYQKCWMSILPSLNSIERTTFETNGTIPLADDFKQRLGSNITFSVSPKLSSSGVQLDKAQKPDVIKEYASCGETYLKFVVHGYDQELKEIEAFLRKCDWKGEVYLMPAGATMKEYKLSAGMVSKIVLDNPNYRFSPRLQVSLFNNQWST